MITFGYDPVGNSYVVTTVQVYMGAPAINDFLFNDSTGHYMVCTGA